MARAPTSDPAGAYERRKESSAANERAKTAAGRDIGGIPAVADPSRLARTRFDFRTFCETYLGERFPLAWSTDHLTAIARIEAAVLHGGRFAFAMPRGSGKSTLCVTACEWALLHAHRRFVVLVGATEPHAEEMLDTIQTSLEHNPLYLADFPATCYPIKQLDGIANRANGQTCGGERTRISWTAKELSLPVVAGAPASGSRVRVAGITGRVRGMLAVAPDGSVIRPDLVITDDPQTDESSASPVQCAAREKVLKGAILGLAGPGKSIAVVMPCTVINPGDLADRVLDRDRNPEWQGERARLLYGEPRNPDLWDQYNRLRRAGMADGRGPADALQFYAANRAAMDAGLTAGWEARLNPGDVSATQHAMDLKLANPRAFAAEYQNAPEPDRAEAGVTSIDADAVSRRLTRLARAAVPREATRLTAFVDVGGLVCWYAVCAFDERFGGSVIDCGAWPKQNRHYFAAADARPTLADAYPGLSEEARVYAGVKALLDTLAGRVFARDGGGEAARIDRILVDSGWLPDAVTTAVKQSAAALVTHPSKGYAVTAGNRAMADWQVVPGEKPGWNWRLGTPAKGRLLTFDPHHWKTFAAERLTTAEGGAGAVQLFGTDPADHHLLADHLASEYGVPTTGRGRTVVEWKLRPGRDNHLFDCVVGCHVAASVAGLKWDAGRAAGDAASGGPAKPKGKRSMAEMRAAARQPAADAG